MGFFGRIFGKSEPAQPEAVRFVAPPVSVPTPIDEVRRWDAALVSNTDQLTWAGATGRSLNEDLLSELPTLITRCTFEASINPTIRGMIKTHADDLIGPTGPYWQVSPKHSKKLTKAERKAFETYASEAEATIADWTGYCSLNGDLSFADILRGEINSQYTAGTAFTQLVSDTTTTSKPIELRLHPIHPERVLSPTFGKAKSGNQVILGVEINRTGKRVRFHVAETFALSNKGIKTTPLPAESVVCAFQSMEPGQIVGIPWLAPCLEQCGDLRTWNKSVTDNQNWPLVLD